MGDNFNSPGVLLLSAIRSRGASTLLAEVPEAFFGDATERSAFIWLRGYVRDYQTFPSPEVFAKETGVKAVKTNEPVEYYLNNVRVRYLYGNFVKHFGSMQEAMSGRDIEKAVETAMLMVREDSQSRITNQGDKTIQLSMQDVLADYSEATKSRGLRGVPTGWPKLTRTTGGWQNGDLVTFVARPGQGKTQLLLYSARAAWLAGYSVLFISMEMGTLQIARRLLGLQSGVNPNFIRDGTLSTDTRKTVLKAAKNISTNNTPFILNVGSFRQSVPVIRAKCMEMRPDIIFVDASYLLLPEKKRGNSAGRREMVSDVIEELKMLAVDINRPVVQSVQFNRQAEKPTPSRPRSRSNNEEQINPMAHLSLAKIGESDVIGQASSIVIGIETVHEMAPGNEPTAGQVPQDDSSMVLAPKRYLGFLKGREGETGYWKIWYDFVNMRFDEINEESDRWSVSGAGADDASWGEHDVNLDWVG